MCTCDFSLVFMYIALWNMEIFVANTSLGHCIRCALMQHIKPGFMGAGSCFHPAFICLDDNKYLVNGL